MSIDKLTLFLKNRVTIYIASILPIIPIFLTYLSTLNSDVTIYPVNKDNTKFTISTYADGTPPSALGNTTITPTTNSGDTLMYSYTMGKKYKYRYAGISMGYTTDSTFINLSKCDYLKIKLKQTKVNSAALFFKINNPKFTIFNKQNTHEFLTTIINVDTNKISEVTIPFAKFNHPGWWLEEQKFLDTELKAPDYSKVISLQIQNGTKYSLDTTISVQIISIKAGKDQSAKLFTLLISLFIYYGSIFTILFIIRSREKASKEKNIVISYEKLDVKNDLDQDANRITNTIAKNYSEAGFSVDKLAKEAGVSASKIPAVLKEKFGMNFKQYLNSIRINEAKRLLKETDNQIVNIAYTVGYNNIPHFNRTFKQIESVSPKQYRKNTGIYILNKDEVTDKDND